MYEENVLLYIYLHSQVIIMCISLVAEGKQLKCFKERNTESGRLWRLLSEEERQEYRDRAKVNGDKRQPISFKKESDKILKQLRKLVSISWTLTVHV